MLNATRALDLAQITALIAGATKPYVLGSLQPLPLSGPEPAHRLKLRRHSREGGPPCAGCGF